MLFAVICNQNKNLAWKSLKHDDGTMYKDYFIVGVETPIGDYTYHYHKDYWFLFEVKEVENAPKWDGHKPENIDRLLSLVYAHFDEKGEVEQVSTYKPENRWLWICNHGYDAYIERYQQWKERKAKENECNQRISCFAESVESSEE
jgi:hypothetical protein